MKTNDDFVGPPTFFQFQCARRRRINKNRHLRLKRANSILEGHKTDKKFWRIVWLTYQDQKSVNKTADFLGINRGNLWSLIVRHGRGKTYGIGAKK